MRYRMTDDARNISGTDPPDLAHTCATCRYWSERVGSAGGGRPTGAMCLNAASPDLHEMVAGRHSCPGWMEGSKGAVDTPGEENPYDPIEPRPPLPGSCEDCRFWSDRICVGSYIPLKALCLNGESPHGGRMVPRARSCPGWMDDGNGKVDMPSGIPHDPGGCTP